jgi:hypothetical protein
MAGRRFPETARLRYNERQVESEIMPRISAMDEKIWLVTCPQCGMAGNGNYCSRCGTALGHEEGISALAHVAAKIRGSFVAFLSYLKTTWLILTQPRRFFRAYFDQSQPLADFAFPLSGIWRLLSDKPQTVLQPFESLLAGVALLAVMAGLSASVAKIARFNERTKKAVTEEELYKFYEEHFHQKLTVVETERLTGIALVDNPLGELVTLLKYLWHPLLIAAFLRPARAHRRQLLQFFVYAMGAALVFNAFFNLGELVVFTALIDFPERISRGLSAGVGLLGGAAIIYFAVILPIIVLPALFPWTRRRVVLAIDGALAFEGAVNLMVSQLLYQGILIK